MLLGQLTVPSGQAFRGLLNARGKSRNLIGVDPPPKVADWEIKCVVFGTDPSDVGLRTDANGHCSAATLQAAPPPPPPCASLCYWTLFTSPFRKLKSFCSASTLSSLKSSSS